MGNSSKDMGDEMSSVSIPQFNSTDKAHSLVKDIAGHAWRGRGDMIDRVFDAVHSAFPKSPWTRRRVRALWHREAARIDWREIRELEFVDEMERAKRLRAEAAKAAHNEFLDHISNTLDRLEVTDAEFHREHRSALRALAFGTADREGGQAPGKGNRGAHVGRARLGQAD